MNEHILRSQSAEPDISEWVRAHRKQAGQARGALLAREPGTGSRRAESTFRTHLDDSADRSREEGDRGGAGRSNGAHHAGRGLAHHVLNGGTGSLCVRRLEMRYGRRVWYADRIIMGLGLAFLVVIAMRLAVGS